jgi:hypothetical protein
MILSYFRIYFRSSKLRVLSCTAVHSYIQCCMCVVRKYESTKVPSKVLSYFRKYFRTIMILYFRKYVYFHYCTLYTYSTYQFLAKSTIDSANGDMILYVYSCTVHVALRLRSAVRKYGSTKVRLYFHRYENKYLSSKISCLLYSTVRVQYCTCTVWYYLLFYS